MYNQVYLYILHVSSVVDSLSLCTVIDHLEHSCIQLLQTQLASCSQDIPPIVSAASCWKCLRDGCVCMEVDILSDPRWNNDALDIYSTGTCLTFRMRHRQGRVGGVVLDICSRSGISHGSMLHVRYLTRESGQEQHAKISKSCHLEGVQSARAAPSC